MRSPSPEPLDDDISTRPFTEQPAFGKGLWRAPIKFVAASSSSSTLPPPPEPKSTSLADAYLSIVFPNGQPKPEAEFEICPTCNQPIKEVDARAHHLTIAHQLALPRAPTPSAIDRTRMGLKYMERHGFDIDSRKGLGVEGEGRLYPIIPKEKQDKYGIGIEVKNDDVVNVKPKEIKLDAGQVRKKATEDRRKAEKLRKMFYEDDKVTQYLGELEEDSGGNHLDLGAFGLSKRAGKRGK